MLYQTPNGEKNMGEHRLPKQVIVCYPVGRKKGKGKPRTTSIGGIRGMMGEMGRKDLE